MKGLLKRAVLVGLATCTLAPFASSAQATGLVYGIGLQAGTLGIGPDFNVGVNKYLGFDLGLNTYSRSYSSSTSNINYDFKAKLNTVHLLASVYPFGGVFHLSAGLVSNGNKFDLTGSPSGSGTYDVNGTSYTAAQVGTLTGKVTFPGTAAYVGMGWGLSYDPGSHWGFNFDLGALYQGKPKVSLTSSGGTLSTDATFQQNLAAEQKQAQDKLSGYQWYPVARLGLYFKF